MNKSKITLVLFDFDNYNSAWVHTSNSSKKVSFPTDEADSFIVLSNVTITEVFLHGLALHLKHSQFLYCNIFKIFYSLYGESPSGNYDKRYQNILKIISGMFEKYSSDMVGLEGGSQSLGFARLHDDFTLDDIKDVVLNKWLYPVMPSGCSIINTELTNAELVYSIMEHSIPSSLKGSVIGVNIPTLYKIDGTLSEYYQSTNAYILEVTLERGTDLFYQLYGEKEVYQMCSIDLQVISENSLANLRVSKLYTFNSAHSCKDYLNLNVPKNVVGWLSSAIINRAKVLNSLTNNGVVSNYIKLLIRSLSVDASVRLFKSGLRVHSYYPFGCAVLGNKETEFRTRELIREIGYVDTL